MMEVLPSKFKSPPPKPPRRRYSDQLTVSPTGTFPSSGKKLKDTSKLNVKENRDSENDAKCGSLPPNWISNYTSDCENPLDYFSKKCISEDCFAQLKSTCLSSQIPQSTTMDKDIKLSENYIKTENLRNDFGRTKKFNLSYVDTVINDNVCPSSEVPEKFFDQSHGTEIDINIKENVKNLEIKSLPSEYHRRHHSDPVFTYSNEIHPKNGLHVSATKNPSTLDTSLTDSHSRLSSSLNVPCELNETHCLHEEIKNLKEINNKLWQHLCSIQTSLEKSKKNADEIPSALSVSDLLSSLYYSQKAKDIAMEDRMKIILEERDTAVQELQDVVQVIARSFKDDVVEDKVVDNEIADLLKEIENTYNPAKLLQQQRLLLTYLYHSKELKQDHLIHKLKFVTTERDHLKDKVKYLNEELKSLKICNELWNSDNKHWENNLLNILCQVIQQRDFALSKVNVNASHEHTSSSYETMRAVDSLLKESKSSPKSNSDFAAKRNSLSAQPEPNLLGSYSNESCDDNRLLKGKLFVLSKALDMEVEKREKVEEKCLKLERLITVLQRKVNGQHVGISV